MIIPRKIYTHNGILVHDDIAPYGIFIYHDVGVGGGRYLPWDKLRIVEVIYIKKARRWFFATRRLIGVMKAKSQSHNSVGVPSSLRAEFFEAIRQMELSAGNLDVQNKSLQKIEGGVDISVVETEDDEIERLMQAMVKAGQKDKHA